MDSSSEITHVFVYGTLKSGLENHRRYCAGLVSAVPAQTRGRLYLLENKGYPIAVVPEQSLVATAMGDFAVDRTQEHAILWKGPPADNHFNEARANILTGELLTFDDARERLPLLDSLETFRPDGSGEYMRCLIWTDPPNPQLAWIYVAPPGWVPDETCRLIDRFPAD